MKLSKIVFILLLALFLRSFWLDRFPVAISGDELIYPFITKFVLLTGSDVVGRWNPLSIFFFQYPSGIFPQAELGYFFSLFSFGSLFLTRLPHMLASVGVVFVLYLFTKQVFSEKVALWVAFLASINPWLIVIGRTGYEMNFAMLFLIGGMYVLLRAKELKHFILSLFLFLLGFYSYIATKLIFLPLILWGVGYMYLQEKKLMKNHYVIVGGGISIVLLYGIILFSQGTSRVGEIFLPTNEVVSQTVDQQRKNSLHTPLSSLMNNKLVVYGDILVQKTAAVFSPVYLFINGDQFYGVESYGLFHVLDVLFLLLGGVLIWKEYKREGIFLIGLLLISVIPQLFHKGVDNFTPHNTLLIPFLLVLTGFGIHHSKELLHKKYQTIFVFLVGGLYLLLTVKFALIYFTRVPLLGNTDLPTRVMARYVYSLQQQGKEVVILSNKSEDFYKKYLFYSHQLNIDTVKEVKESLQSKKYTIHSVTFASCDLKLVPEENKIYVTQSECGDPETTDQFIKLSRLRDGGEVFRIYHDPFCNYDLLPHFISTRSFSLFAVERLTPEEICTGYMTK